MLIWALSAFSKNREGGLDDFEKKHYLEKVKTNFDNMKFDYFVTIDGNRPVDDVWADVRAKVDELIKENQS